MSLFKIGVENGINCKREYLINLSELKNRNLALLKTLDYTFAKSLEVPLQSLTLKDWYMDLMSIDEDEGIETMLFFDTETSHLNGYASSIALVLTDREFNILEQKYIEINPQVIQDPEAIAVHGLTDKYLRDKPVFAEVEPLILSVFEKADVILAHNVRYDQGVIMREYERLGKRFPEVLKNYFDTMVGLKNQIVFKGIKRKNPKLSEAAHLLGIDLSNVKLHAAIDDTLLMLEVVRRAVSIKQDLIQAPLTSEIVERFKNENK